MNFLLFQCFNREHFWLKRCMQFYWHTKLLYFIAYNADITIPYTTTNCPSHFFGSVSVSGLDVVPQRPHAHLTWSSIDEYLISSRSGNSLILCAWSSLFSHSLFGIRLTSTSAYKLQNQHQHQHQLPTQIIIII